ncbi:MAG TPA: arsenic resistance N-acetyltransferase ArsN2 [Gemmatimonadaceae bacterium]|nr:arsenic resistance N-acetyltransferase ArsN2 [Gemmatimonadaceae bacterium]
MTNTTSASSETRGMSAAPTSAAPSLRPATSADLAAVERLLTDAKLTTAGVAELFAERAGDFIVADDPERGGEIVAVAGLEMCCNDALLRSVAVRPDWRARGLGHELVRRVVSEAESRGLRALYLLTTTAEHYFPRFGFARVERDAVPAEVRDTAEFKGACPASAVAMARPVGGPPASA